MSLNRISFTVVGGLLFSSMAFGQGTPAVLRCSFNGGLDLRAGYEPLTPIVARVNCGDTVLVIDQRFGSAHLRTESGVDGYIHALNLGQFRFEPVAVQASPQAVVQPVASLPTVQPIAVTPARTQFAPESSFRRFEITWNAVEFQRQQTDVNLWGGTLSFAVHLNDRLAIVAELGSHEPSGDSGRLAAFRGGPRLKLGNSEKVKPFVEVLVGGARASEEFSVFGLRVETHQNFFSGVAGGGFDVRIRDWVAWRAVQGGYSAMYSSENGLSNGFRVGTGIVFRFGRGRG